MKIGKSNIFTHPIYPISSCHPLKAFPYLTQLVGMEGIFLLHCTALLIGAVFALFALPETRNKSISELEAIFVKKEETSHCESSFSSNHFVTTVCRMILQRGHTKSINLE